MTEPTKEPFYMISGFFLLAVPMLSGGNDRFVSPPIIGVKRGLVAISLRQCLP